VDTIPAGLDGVELLISYDPNVLTVEAVRAGNVTSNLDYFWAGTDVPGVIRIDSSTRELPFEAVDGGTLAEIDFRIQEDAVPGPTSLDLQEARLNDGHYTLTPEPVIGYDGSDGQITVLTHEPVVAMNTAIVNDEVAVTAEQRMVVRTEVVPPSYTDRSSLAAERLADMKERHQQEVLMVDAYESFIEKQFSRLDRFHSADAVGGILSALSNSKQDAMGERDNGLNLTRFDHVSGDKTDSKHQDANGSNPGWQSYFVNKPDQAGLSDLNDGVSVSLPVSEEVEVKIANDERVPLWRRMTKLF